MSRKRKKKDNYQGPARDEVKEGLHPAMAEGMTEGLDAEQAFEILPQRASSADGTELGFMREGAGEKIGRVPTPRLRVRDSTSSDLVTVFPDGRAFRDTERIYPPDVLRAIKAGYLCFRCLEPQERAFGDDHLPGCEGVALHGPTYMAERQIMDVAMEMDDAGEVHLGPSKPISEYLAEQDLRVEMAKFRADLESRGAA